MTQEQYEQLIRIYNTLNTITTKGDNTIVMGTCLSALSQLIQELDADLNIEG